MGFHYHPQVRWSTLSALLILLASSFLVFADAQSVMNDATRKQLDKIVSDNTDRRNQSRIASAFIYLFVCIGMAFLAALFSILLGWMFTPFRHCKCMSPDPQNPKTIKANTLIWFLILLIILFVVSAAAGFPGWIVVCIVYFLACVIALIFVGIVHCRYPSHRTVVPVTTDQYAPTNITVKQADVEDPAKTPGGVTDSPFPIPAVEVREAPAKRPHWTSMWEPMGRMQLLMGFISGIISCVCAIVLVILVYAWTIPDYELWHFKESRITIEAQPQLNAKTLALLYSWEGMASNMRLNLYTKIFTSHCGTEFTKSLKPSDKRAKIYDDWITSYSIDMTLFTPSDYNQYDSINDFFIRKMNFTVPYRAVDLDMNSEVGLVSPCDCRILVYPNFADATVWVKGDHYSPSDLLDNEPLYKNTFDNGWIAICRLAPSDYHRFHSPVYGKLVYHKQVSGTYWSVGSEAARSSNKVFLNLRRILVIQTPSGHNVAFVAIGATCVGSVVIHNTTIGREVKLGEELGYMQFGGSTVVLMFERNAVSMDPFLIEASKYPVESYTHVLYSIGNATLG